MSNTIKLVRHFTPYNTIAYYKNDQQTTLHLVECVIVEGDIGVQNVMRFNGYDTDCRLSK